MYRILTILTLAAISLLPAASATAEDAAIGASQPETGTKFRIGVESIIPGKDDWFATIYGTWYGKNFTEEQLGNALREVGAEFTLFYDSIAPKKKNGCVRATDMCQRLNMPFLFNNTYGDIQGPWRPGTGRAEFKAEDIGYAAKSGLFLGVIWDEVEHRQLNHIDAGRGPYFIDAAGLTPEQCHAHLVEAIREACHQDQGTQDVAEFVFPSMFHIFAQAGMIPAPKVLKESIHPIMLSMAMGAALQYEREMWVVADLWGVVPFWGTIYHDGYEGNPGHCPDEYVSSLMMAYWMGSDAIYTEGLYDLITVIPTTDEEWQDIHANPISHRGEGNPLVLQARQRGYILTAYGKMHRAFVKHYLPAHPRPYTFRDVRPEVAIVTFPDSTWCRRGAAKGWASDPHLFGPQGPAKEARHEAILDVWHILTHGQVPRESISYHGAPFVEHRTTIAAKIAANPEEYPFDDPHTGFCPLHGVVVFDHQVSLERLEGIPLIICTGELISTKTQEAIDACVRNGAKCLTLPHLLPHVLPADTVKSTPVQTGKGSYLLVDDFTSAESREYIQPHLGPPDEVRYTFGVDTVHLTPTCGDERRLSVRLERAQ